MTRFLAGLPAALLLTAGCGGPAPQLAPLPETLATLPTSGFVSVVERTPDGSLQVVLLDGRIEEGHATPVPVTADGYQQPRVVRWTAPAAGWPCQGGYELTGTAGATTYRRTSWCQNQNHSLYYHHAASLSSPRAGASTARTGFPRHEPVRVILVGAEPWTGLDLVTAMLVLERRIPFGADGGGKAIVETAARLQPVVHSEVLKP